MASEVYTEGVAKLYNFSALCLLLSGIAIAHPFLPFGMKIISLAIGNLLICISTNFRSIQSGAPGKSKGCSLRSRFLHEKNLQLQYQETDFSESNRYHSGHSKDVRLGKRFRKFVEQLSHGITENTSLVC